MTRFTHDTEYGGPSEEHYGNIFNPASDSTQQENDNPNTQDDLQDIKHQEETPPEAPSWENKTTSRESASKKQGLRSRVVSVIKDKKKGPAIAITLGLITGGLGIGMLSMLPFGAIGAIANLKLDIDDVSPASQIRSYKVTERKFIPRLGGPVGAMCAVPGSVKCKFSTMSDTMVERYRRVGIEIVGEPIDGIRSRTRVTRVIDHVTGTEYEPGDFHRAINDRSMRWQSDSIGARVYRAHNMGWLGHHGPVFRDRVLRRFGIDMKVRNVTGSNPQERVAQLLARSSGSTLKEIDFVEAKNANGETIVDDRGNPKYTQVGDPDPNRTYTGDERNALLRDVKRIQLANTPMMRKAFQAASVVGMLDIGCEIIDTVGRGSVAAKTFNKEQLSMLASEIVPAVGALQANDLSPEQAEMLGEFFFATDSRKNIPGVNIDADYNAIDKNADEINPENNTLLAADVTNPDYGKNALDSEPFKVSMHGSVAGTSAASTTYSLGFGVNRVLSSAAAFASTARYLSEIGGGIGGCDIIQSTPIRVFGAVAGVAGILLTGGTNLVWQGALAITMWGVSYYATSLLNSYLSTDLINEDMVNAPVERGVAVWTGMAAIHSQDAQSRGMIPGNAEQIVTYQVERNRYKQEYIASQRQESSLLDIRNPYSVTGSIVTALQTHLPNRVSGTALSSLPTDISSFVLSGLASGLKPYSVNAQSLDPERFKRCDDRGYKDIGLDADIQCNVRYYMPERLLIMDPLEVAEWMEKELYVEENTTTGLPKGYTPKDARQDQSLAKQIVSGAVGNFVNTRSFGDDDKAKLFGKFLDFCVYRTLPLGETYEENSKVFGAAEDEWYNGKNCMVTGGNEGSLGYILDRFRVYVFDMSVSDDLDESPVTNFSGQNAGESDGSALPGWTVSRDERMYMGYSPNGHEEPALRLKHSMLDNGSTDFYVSQLHGPGNSAFAIANQHSIYAGYDFPSFGFHTVGHPGYDIAMPMGTKLYSPVNGTVVTAGGSGYFYNTPGEAHTPGTGELKIRLSNGDEVILGHMQTISVKVGDTVSPGTFVGGSGYVAGPHLHLEYRKKDSSCSSGYCIVDPTHYIP